ncbi:unnamed protein product [Diabrotica balteata]|uniref:CIDE-N domain-containing protein n=1 Tax=Diabrotica balteata TaxID=107213 RepID=A0A9P0E0V5_DIABA|nr:unnamed protein product [Diabrotica balteata]
MTTTKGFKVTDADRKTRVGIAVKNLEELKKKTIDKFKLKFSPGEIDFQTTDGTIIENEEYFQTLPPQTLLIWVKAGEKAATDAEILYKTIREVNDEYLTAGEKVQEFFTEKMKSKVLKLAEVLKGLDADKAKLSSRSEHPEWFRGANSGNSDDMKSICDRQGTFQCQGRWDKEQCLYSPTHSINPYLSRESRIIFQTWNLDHNKERSRSVIPAVCAALRSSHLAAAHAEIRRIHVDLDLDKKGKHRNVCLDIKGIYNDLFTLNNLKFVHIVCHDKGAHVSAKAGPYLLQ